MSANPVLIARKSVAGDDVLCPEALIVRDTLIRNGLETPMLETGITPQEKYEHIRELMAEVVRTLGLDLSDDSLAETPHRIAKMYVQEIFSGLDYRNFPKLSLIENKMGVNEMVKIRDIDLTSTCEHHFVTIDGVAKVAYIPRDRIIGLSKINRIVRFFGQRPQVQERLTQQTLTSTTALGGCFKENIHTRAEFLNP
jgi:GTP cyclohydrolase I